MFIVLYHSVLIMKKKNLFHINPDLAKYDLSLII